MGSPTPHHGWRPRPFRAALIYIGLRLPATRRLNYRLSRRHLHGVHAILRRIAYTHHRLEVEPSPARAWNGGMLREIRNGPTRRNPFFFQAEDGIRDGCVGRDRLGAAHHVDGVDVELPGDAGGLLVRAE